MTVKNLLEYWDGFGDVILYGADSKQIVYVKDDDSVCVHYQMLKTYGDKEVRFFGTSLDMVNVLEIYIK